MYVYVNQKCSFVLPVHKIIITSWLYVLTFLLSISVFHWYCGKHVIVNTRNKLTWIDFTMYLSFYLWSDRKIVSHLRLLLDKMINDRGMVSAFADFKNPLCYVLTDKYFYCFFNIFNVAHLLIFLLSFLWNLNKC